MDVLRRNLFFIVSGIAAAGGVALGVTGFKSAPNVKQEMDKAVAVSNALDGLQKDSINQKRLEEEEKRIAIVKADHAKVVEKAKELYRYDLLVPDVLPDGEPLARISFRRKYGDAMREMVNRLTGGKPATPEDVRAMEDRIKDEDAARKEHEKNPGSGLAKPPTESGPPQSTAGVLTKAGVFLDPKARADINAAQRFYLYLQEPFQPKTGDQRVPSLMFESSMWDVDTTEPPAPEEVWRAQLQYWIQKDVVDAIVAVNTEAAEHVRKANEDPWIGNMPIKEIIAIRLSDSFVEKSEEKFYSPAPGDYKDARPPGTPATVFTQSASSESFEILQFTVKMVMDQRDIQFFVERLCNNRFHTPLRIAYKTLPANRTMTGKIYGAEPAVNVVMDFETVLLGEVFRRWMPPQVIADEKIKCRPQDECAK